MTYKSATSATPRLKIGFVLARSFTLSAFAMFVDTLRLASDELDRSGRVLADWQVVGSTRHLIKSSCGVEVAPTSDFVDPAQFNYIVVVGGLLNVERPVDYDTIAFLKRADAQKVPLIGVCTGSFILAEAGLMKNHETCVSWLHYHAFRERFPDLLARSDRLYHLDRTRGSCAGGSSAADMAASIVRQSISRDAERNALEVLQIERARTALDIQPRRPLDIECSDDRLKSILIVMERHVENVISLKELADSVGISRRQLERLFQEKTGMSPGQAYMALRMHRARALLLQSKAPLIEIAIEVGFESAGRFGKVFKRTYGQPPGRLRGAMAH